MPESLKTNDGREALNPESLVCRTVHTLKENCPEACVITDIALDPYSNVGHDGIVSPKGTILNDSFEKTCLRTDMIKIINIIITGINNVN